MNIPADGSSSRKQFACQFPNCNASYHRKEHLSRHAARHVQKPSFKCSICHREFGRSDTLRRHVVQQHKVSEPIRRTRACASCRGLKTRCDGQIPCGECSRRQIQCSLPSESSAELSDSQGLDRPNRIERKQHSIAMYFERFHPYWPFVHMASFNYARENPLLIQSLVVIGLWSSGEKNARSAAIQLHNVLGSAISQQREKWECLGPSSTPCSGRWPMSTYQAILLHVLFSFISRETVGLGWDLKPVLQCPAAEILSALIASCKNLGMFYYPNILAQFQEDTLASYIWVGTEEVKRFNMALYKLSRALSSSSDPQKPSERSTCTISPEDLQFPLPTNDFLWNAATREDWEIGVSAVGSKVVQLNDPVEDTWISKSAEVLRYVEQEGYRFTSTFRVV
ncbi:hypothetical protein BJX99DRAFT_223540 [Aspergillus californicus]